MKFLFRTLDDNGLIRLVYKGENGRSMTFGSRFLDYKKKKYIIIANPYGESGTYQQLVRKDQFTAYFISQGFRFKFSSEVLKRDTFKFQGDVEVPVLVITMPTAIYDSERRNFFRVETPTERPIIVRFLSYFDSNVSFDIQQEMPEIQDSDMVECELHDLSGGGMSIRSNSPLEIMTGDIINLRFAISSDEFSNLQVEGLINNSRVGKDKKTQYKGIEFIPDGSDAYRNALKTISRYVMNRQRAMINLYGR